MSYCGTALTLENGENWTLSAGGIYGYGSLKLGWVSPEEVGIPTSSSAFGLNDIMRPIARPCYSFLKGTS